MNHANTDRVRITDVAPRDGLQNEARPVPTADKARLVESLLACGLDEIEVTSFVSPKWIPQLGDAAQLLALITPAVTLTKNPPLLSALVPNEQGLDALIKANTLAGRNLIGKASVFTAASETFARRNINASIAQSLDRFKPVITRAHDAGLKVRGYISCVIACPFEGPIAPEQVTAVAADLADIGVDEIDLGDTIGAATPDTTLALLDSLRSRLGRAWMTWTSDDEPFVTLHLHDTFGGAAACVKAALQAGVRSFDAASGGLGGCPYASTPGKRAPGNISTLALIDAITGSGLNHGASREALTSTAALAQQITTAS